MNADFLRVAGVEICSGRGFPAVVIRRKAKESGVSPGIFLGHAFGLTKPKIFFPAQIFNADNS
jgi:hypothetical protein